LSRAVVGSSAMTISGEQQIASAINSVNGYGVVIEDGATIKEA